MKTAPIDDAQQRLAQGHALPQRWQQRDRFVVLDIAFGAGLDFLATWQLWRADPQRCERLVYLAIEPRPLRPDELAAAHGVAPDAPGAELAALLREAWPPPTRNLHRLVFEAGRVELMLAVGDVRGWLTELVAEVDAFRIDETAALAARSTLEPRDGRACARLAGPRATLLSAHADAAWAGAWASAGFRLLPDSPPLEMRSKARFEPDFTPRRPVARQRGASATPSTVAPHALVIGAGLAGCASAWALAGQGWRSTLLERHAEPAREASGNAAGLFHGIVHAQDGVHTRFNRAAALAATGAVRAAIERGVPGDAGGLLRLETTMNPAQMQARLDHLGLPPAYVRAVDAHEASAIAGIALPWPCWHYPGGGWVEPGGLARAFLARAGALASLRVDQAVAALRRGGAGWAALDARGTVLAEAPSVVLANAGDAMRLLDEPAWPIDNVRGQVSTVAAARLALPRVPIAGHGYLLPAVAGRAVFGATAQPGDVDAAVRDADHAANLEQLARLIGHAHGLVPAELEGRTGWRCSAADRLPVIGAVPDTSVSATRSDQPRFVPRVPGLFVNIALGSRGITWSALGAQVLASWVTGSPAPLEAGLLDAIDPARFVSRRVRRAASLQSQSRSTA